MTPPTTPPAIAPVLVCDELSEFGAEVADDVVVAVAFKVDVDVGVDVALAVEVASSQQTSALFVNTTVE